MIRIARLQDAQAIANLSRRLIEHGLPWRWRGDRIRRAIRNPETIVIVDERASRVSGFLLCTVSDVSIHISLLAVAGDYQRQGIASDMLDWVIASARVAGVARVTLEVRAENEVALQCYFRHGFEEVAIRSGYYEGREDARALTLTLIPAAQERKRP